MATNEEQIRTLIKRWAEADHHGDLIQVLADHTEDIVMFDVPPPHQGVRGLDAYRETWPPFFQWQAQGASFEIESLEVTAGDDVAFAYALQRCGTERDFADNPDNRLPATRANATPDAERCEPRPRASPFLVNECRRTSSHRTPTI